MFKQTSNPFGAMLHVRFAEANGRFKTFALRKRMAAEYFTALERMNAFDGVFLPKDTPAFLRANYCERVPHHGIVHPLPMLITAASEPYRERTPLATRLAIVGHDAGHNGDADDSPETFSAALTSFWMLRNRDWLDRQGLRQKQRNTGRVLADPQIATTAIMATRFPHLPGDVSEDARWMRWYDTFRAAAGSSAPALNDALQLDGRMTRLQALLLESLGLVDEHTPPDENPHDYLGVWLKEGVAERFIMQQVERDLCFVNQYYPSNIPAAEWGAPRNNYAALQRLVANPEGLASKVPQRVHDLYAFFRQDITVTEFVAKCEELGIR